MRRLHHLAHTLHVPENCAKSFADRYSHIQKIQSNGSAVSNTDCSSSMSSDDLCSDLSMDLCRCIKLRLL